MKKYILLSFYFAFFAACSEEIPEEAQFEVLEFRQIIPLIEGDQDSIAFKIEFKFPELTSYTNQNVVENVNFELNTIFFGNEGIYVSNNPRQNFNKLVENLSLYYRKEGLLFKKKFPAMASTLNYELMKGGAVVYNRNKLLSVSFEIYDYSGGAHGINTIEYLHFDMNSGQVFGLDDLFDESGQQKLLELVSASCDQMKKNKESEVYEESEIETCKNFYFDDQNFYFVYNPYEIGPYSAGYISISIPIKEIKPLLKKDIHPGFIK